MLPKEPWRGVLGAESSWPNGSASSHAGLRGSSMAGAAPDESDETVPLDAEKALASVHVLADGLRGGTDDVGLASAPPRWLGTNVVPLPLPATLAPP